MLKALILSGCKKSPPDITADRERFALMLQALAEGGISARHSSMETVPELEILLDGNRPDITFSAAYDVTGASGERLNLHTVLERAGLPFIGSSGAVLARVLSKAALKTLWRASGVSTPDFFTIENGPSKKNDRAFPAEILRSAVGFPFIVKPEHEGNSRGIDESSVVHTVHDLVEKIEELSGRYGSVLVERFLGFDEGIREFTVAFIGNGDNAVIMPSEIVLTVRKDVRVITTGDKDNHRTRAVPVGDPVLKNRLIAFASEAFAVSGVRDYARCDVLLSGGSFHALEINGQPMLPDAWFDACALDLGMDRVQYLNAVFLAGIVRNMNDGFPGLGIPGRSRAVVPPGIFSKLVKTSEGAKR